LASSWLTFCCAAACEPAVAVAAAPSASAAPVSTTRREMHSPSFLPLFMIDSNQADFSTGDFEAAGLT
jgi:hypothetical protein